VLNCYVIVRRCVQSGNCVVVTMTIQEQAIFVEGSAFSYHMEWKLSKIDRERLQTQLRSLMQCLAQFPSVNALIAFGDHAWTLVTGGDSMPGLRAFTPIGMSSSRYAPSTQRDVLVWLHSDRHDENFRAALAINTIMKTGAELRLELMGFRYQDSRDLTGFVDGSANPQSSDAQQVALVASPHVGAGGSFVITQQWQHDLVAFNGLSVSQQELVVGRTKADSVELDPAHMPADAHVARNDISDKGKPLKIYRRSSPYGTVDANGLYFLAFSAELERFTHLLESMYGLRDKGKQDQLLKFSKPLTGSYWFAPSLAQLQQIVD